MTSPRPKRKLREWKSRLGWFAFILPVVIGVAVFSFYPIIVSLYDSMFKTYSGITNFPEWTIKGYSNFGFANYVRAFTMDTEVWKALGITLLYAVVVVPACLVLSFGIALLLNSALKGIGVFRVLYYLPVLIPSTISGMLWADFFDVRFGLANSILTGLGLPAGTFFTSSSTALVTFMCLNFWTLGASMILWLSALKNVPTALIEAAKLDGAGWWCRLFRIILPMCSNIFFYNLVTGIIGALQMFGPVITLMGASGPGPDNSLLFFGYKIYNEAFSKYNMGYACALGWILFVIIGLLTVLIFRTNRFVYYGDGGGKSS